MEINEDFIIRRINVNELDDVIKINELCLPEHYPRYFWEEHLRRWNDIFLVAEINGKIVGYVMCRVELGWGYTRKGIIKKGHVISIAVLQEYRRRGIGRALMENVMKVLKEKYGVHEVYLEVRVSNTPAINLYKKLGFSIIRVVPGYYHDGEDAYIMARSL